MHPISELSKGSNKIIIANTEHLLCAKLYFFLILITTLSNNGFHWYV